MNLEIILYLINLASNIQIVLIVSSIFGLSLFGLYICTYISLYTDSIISIKELEDDHSIFNKKIRNRFSIILVCIISIATLMPSERIMYLMASSHYMKQTDIPQKVLKILNNKLDEMLEDKKSESI
jgi:hypothetical protein